jgi:hypothetical protein
MGTGFGAASYWSLTGALAAGFTLGLYLLLLSGSLWHADVTLTIGWAIFATFGVVFWFWPFLASYYMYLPLRAIPVMRTRPGSALYGAFWHTAAHCLLVRGLDSEPWSTALIVPVVVGGLWGSWLPAAHDPAAAD